MLRVAGMGVITQCGIKLSTSAGTHGTILYSLFHLWQTAFLGGRTLIVTKLSCLVSFSSFSPLWNILHIAAYYRSKTSLLRLSQSCFQTLQRLWFSVGHTRLFRTRPNPKTVYDQTHGLPFHCQATPIYFQKIPSKQEHPHSHSFLKERVQVLSILPLPTPSQEELLPPLVSMATYTFFHYIA